MPETRSTHSALSHAKEDIPTEEHLTVLIVGRLHVRLGTTILIPFHQAALITLGIRRESSTREIYRKGFLSKNLPYLGYKDSLKENFMSEFLTKAHCDMCGKELDTLRNEEGDGVSCLCIECKNKETNNMLLPDTTGTMNLGRAGSGKNYETVGLLDVE